MANVTEGAGPATGASKAKVFRRKALIAAVSEKTGLPAAKAALAIDAVFESIRVPLFAGIEVRIAKFGAFAVKDRKTKPGAEMTAPAKKAVRFRAGKDIRKQLSQGAA